MNKYNNAKIYTIRSPHTEKIYIGATCETLCRRFTSHNRKNNGASSKDIIILGDNYNKILKKFSCNNKEELNKREGELIRQFKDQCVNFKITGRDEKEYYQDNKEKLLEQQKQYDKNNKEKKKIRMKEYRQCNKDFINKQRAEKITCECGDIISKSSLYTHIKTLKHLSVI